MRFATLDQLELENKPAHTPLMHLFWVMKVPKAVVYSHCHLFYQHYLLAPAFCLQPERNASSLFCSRNALQEFPGPHCIS